MVSQLPISNSVIVSSNPNAIVEVCKQILSKLKDNDFSQEDLFAVHLAVEEAFINAVTHGNKMDVSKEVRIDYSLDVEKIEITMTDEGAGFNPKVVPDPRLEENLYKTDGRGLFLISSYMDKVEIGGSGNSVRMVRYKARPS